MNNRETFGFFALLSWGGGQGSNRYILTSTVAVNLFVPFEGMSEFEIHQLTDLVKI